MTPLMQPKKCLPSTLPLGSTVPVAWGDTIPLVPDPSGLFSCPYHGTAVPAVPEWYDKAEVNATGWLIASFWSPNETDIEHPYSLSDFCFLWMLTNGTSTQVEENFLVCVPKVTSTPEEVR